MEILRKPDGLEVVIRDNVVISVENGLFNFRQYLEEKMKEFETEYSKTMYSIILPNSTT